MQWRRHVVNVTNLGSSSKLLNAAELGRVESLLAGAHLGDDDDGVLCFDPFTFFQFGEGILNGALKVEAVELHEERLDTTHQ